jgi:hypothetical protein
MLCFDGRTVKFSSIQSHRRSDSRSRCGDDGVIDRRGQPQTPPPGEGLRLYAEQVLSSGFGREAVRQMMCINPARLLDEKE